MNEIMTIKSKNLTRELLETNSTIMRELQKVQDNIQLMDNIIEVFSDNKPHVLKDMMPILGAMYDPEDVYAEPTHQKTKAMIKKLVIAGVMERIERTDGTIELKNHFSYDYNTGKTIYKDITVPNTIVEFRLLER